VTLQAQPREDRIPVEHRLLGLDRRSFPYALSVLGVFLLATVVVPHLDDSIAWDDPVRAGEQFALARDVVFTPAAGWNVESGFRVGPDGSTEQRGSALLVHDGVTFGIEVDDFAGTPTELLAQVEKVTSSTSDPTFMVDGDPVTVTTRTGEVGVLQAYRSAAGDGLVSAFVIDDVGLEITAYGPPPQMSAALGDVDDMVASIRPVDDGDRG
jgi:hypothetical protein